MNQPLRDKLSQRLLQSGRRGWGYSEKNEPSADPTALACIALAAQRRESENIQAGLRFLADLQLDSGAVPTTAELPQATWTTPLAVLAWCAVPSAIGGQYEGNCRLALDWMLGERGLTFTSNPRIYGHNTKLSAWPWISGTHSWVEPTAYAMMALRALGYAENSRFREAADLLRDRAIPGSGWNYGNPKMFGAALRPFPAPTGIALAALAGQSRDAVIDDGIAYLRGALRTIRAPSSLAWGLIGLSLWNARPPESENWLAESAERVLAGDSRPTEEALLLMAFSGDKAFDNILATAEVASEHA